MPAKLSILSGEVFDSRKKLFAWLSMRGADAFDMYLWTGRTLLVELEFLGGVEGLAGGSELAAENEVDDSITTGNAMVRVLKE